MTCSNASGTHKLEMLVTDKAAKPREFKNQSFSHTQKPKPWLGNEKYLLNGSMKVLSHQ
jgi:hypothetical protein